MIPNTRYMKIPAALLLLYLFSCEHPTEPKPDPGPDTTSHHFIWRVDTLGSMFSWANCAEIVDENDIWVGGRFFGWNRDGSRSTDSMYNLVHWNGLTWEYRKVMFQFSDGSSIFQQSPIKQIKKFPNGMFFILSDGSESVITDFDKITYRNVNTSVNVFWARTHDDIYFAGNSGAIVHFDGLRMQKIETGTKINLTDIWGDDDRVYAVGENGYNSVLVEVTGKTARVVAEVPNDPIKMGGLGIMMSVFKLNSNSPLWILGGADHFSLYEVTNTNPFSYKTLHVNTDYFPGSLVRASAKNDIYLLSTVSGQFIHYNGKSWREFIPLQSGNRFWDFQVKGNMWVNVGDFNMGAGIAIRGKRL